MANSETLFGLPRELFSDHPMTNPETEAIAAWTPEETYQNWLADGFPRDAEWESRLDMTKVDLTAL